jgi:hypothetical protein
MSDTTKEAMVLIGELHAAKESLRWETAMRDVADDLTRRDQACQRLIAENGFRKDRIAGKASAYANAAEMLRAAIAAMKETP